MGTARSITRTIHPPTPGHFTMLRARPSRRPAAIAAGLTLAAGSALLVAPADSAFAVGTPKLKVVSVGHTSFTVEVSGTGGRFKLYAAHTIKGVSVVNFGSAESSKWTHSKHVTITGLKYSTDPYYYRLIAEAGGHHAYSAIDGPVGLAPSKPTNLALSTPSGAISLKWDSKAATGYQIVQATDAQLSQGRKIYTMHGPDQQFTPLGLTPGTTYFFAVRARNLTSHSGWSSAVSGTAASKEQSLSTVTYNIREAVHDNEPDGSNHGAPWSARKGPAAALLRSAMPDVIAIQEGASFVDGSTTERQADSLTDQLGAPYKLARTEIPPTEKHYFRTGDYIIYNSNRLAPIGNGDHWDLGHASLGTQHWAAYQEFQVIGSGAQFAFVAFHLIQKNDNPATDDVARQDQATSMFQQAHTKFPNVPIVYGGDTNSALEGKHVVDSARVAARAFGIDDAFDAAQSRHNTKYNSANGYNEKPPAFSDDIDAILTEPGVGVSTWDELLNLSHGKFVTPIPSDHNPVVAGVEIPY
ncbi:MAG TPA: hypothetical protein VHD81_02080 [Mycobacteriales bacterium]|nr:hypothetical protein [Mycobacteriales bacterium]